MRIFFIKIYSAGETLAGPRRSASVLRIDQRQPRPEMTDADRQGFAQRGKAVAPQSPPPAAHQARSAALAASRRGAVQRGPAMQYAARAAMPPGLPAAPGWCRLPR